MLGTGHQARAQLMAALAVRDFKTVKVFSRNPDHRRRFAEGMSQSLGREIRAVDSAQEFVAGSDVILCVTNSPDSVFDAKWVKSGAHINTIGPKYRHAHEIPLELIGRTEVLATDSLAQLEAYPKPLLAVREAQEGKIAELADILAGKAPGRRSADGVTLFFSVGLAGTEVVVAGEVLRKAEERENLRRQNLGT